VRAVVLYETGGPDVLRYDEVPDPEPGEGEVLVRLEAIGVNRYDLNQRAGGASELPTILGGDGAGVRVDTGERVLVTGPANRTYAELTALPEERVHPIPDSLSFEAAAALGVPYNATWHAVATVGELSDGDTLLVQAGSSATGQACVDIGRALGAKVFATASPAKLERLRELGAEALAYDDPRIAELGADVVYDPVGADTFARSVSALGGGGRLVVPGAVSSPDVSLDVWALVGKRARVIGIAGQDEPPETLERLIAMAGTGELKPVIDRVLPLEQAAEAHRAIEARETFGKVILEP
jgi:NADPH:quinone reductase-like Zn-dependent oxidoreductase